MPLRIYIYDPDEFERTEDNMDLLEEAYMQKYVLSFSDSEYLRQTDSFTFPPNDKMRDIEMTPPWNQQR